MMVRPASRMWWVGVAPLLPCLTGCATELPTGVTVGLTTDLAVGFDVDAVEVTTKADGAAARTMTLSYAQGTLHLPAELGREPLPDGAAIEVSVRAFRDHGGSPFLTRLASTRAVGGRTVLLPLSLDGACVEVPCADGTTCAGGACLDPFLPPSALAEYDPSWLTAAPDACKNAASAPPSLVIGQGSDGYTPLADEEVVPIAPGLQGGYHLWLALRVTGLRQMRSQVKVRGRFSTTGKDVPTFTSSLTLRRAEGGACEVRGLRFQVADGSTVAAIQGQSLAIEAELTDPDGDSATASKRVVIMP